MLSVPLAARQAPKSEPERSPGPWREGYQMPKSREPAGQPGYEEQQAARTPPDDSDADRRREHQALGSTLAEARNLKTLAESGAETTRLQLERGLEANEDLLTTYQRAARGLTTTVNNGSRFFAEISDAKGEAKPDVHPFYISTRHHQIRAEVVGYKADLEGTPAYMRGELKVRQADDNIQAAKQVREVAKKGAEVVATMAGGPLAGDAMGVAMDTADEIIGQRGIEKGQSTTLAQAKTILQVKVVQRTIDKGAKALGDKLVGHPVLKDILKHYGIDAVSGLAKDILELAMVKGPNGPTLQPTPGDLARAARQALRKCEQRLQARAKSEIKFWSGDWDFADPDFADYLSDRAFEVIDVLAESEAQGKG